MEEAVPKLMTKVSHCQLLLKPLNSLLVCKMNIEARSQKTPNLDYVIHGCSLSIYSIFVPQMQQLCPIGDTEDTNLEFNLVYIVSLSLINQLVKLVIPQMQQLCPIGDTEETNFEFNGVKRRGRGVLA